ncbi:MAG: IS21 family transposase [Planctomycetaceae bacterium]|nr:IS21 family transposase [Planctomycetota bacterium]MCK6576114.1 IS21 family transposase [Myxococcota bacterium]NUN52096.1 IS21 family transposase [Planctomycetaceae bacterium]
MIPAELEAKILRLFHAEHWPVGTIARQVGVHHVTVRRVLAQAGELEAARSPRPRRVDPFVPFIQETLKQYPLLRASRLYQMVRDRGYTGAPDHFRHVVALYRPRPAAEAFLRLKTLPGEQAQVDWGHFGTLRVGNAERPLMGFFVVLSWCRAVFLRFFLDARMSSFLTGHQAAFLAWGGCPRICLYDNLKSAVLERHGDAIRFHPELLAFSAHYRYEPRPVAPYRGNEKGRVERAIQYARHSFFAARTFKDLDDLNEQARRWCDTIAADRPCPEDATLTVRQAFEQERPLLLPLPENPFPTAERLAAAVGKTPYVRFDGNDYSVPHDRVRRTLTVLATEDTVRVIDGTHVVATHSRSYRRGEQVEDPLHIQTLVDRKREARQHRGMDRLSHAVPPTSRLLISLAERGGNLGSATAALLRLLDAYGPVELDLAVKEALDRDAPHPHAVRHVLERRRTERGLPPPIPVALPDDPRVRNLVVKPHDLTDYDHLEGTDDDDPTA